MDIQEGEFRGRVSGETAVATLGKLMIEKEKTKRFLIFAAAALFIVAALMVVFAPEGRENAAYALGAVLLIIALGAIGATRFALKVPGIEVNAGQQERTKEHDNFAEVEKTRK